MYVYSLTSESIREYTTMTLKPIVYNTSAAYMLWSISVKSVFFFM